MVVSAEASFLAAGLLIPAGVFGTRLALRKDRRLWPLAAVPIGFGVQQAVDGVVWLGIGHDQDWLVQAAAKLFLLFAVAVWPVWFSVVAAVSEDDERRRTWCWGIAVVNSLWFLAGYLPFVLFVGLNVRTAEGSIRYDDVDQVIGWFLGLLYFVCGAAPLLVASRRRLFVPLIILAGGAGFVSAMVYERAFTSVWSFSSAVLSGYICWQMVMLPDDEPEPDTGG